MYTHREGPEQGGSRTIDGEAGQPLGSLTCERLDSGIAWHTQAAGVMLDKLICHEHAVAAKERSRKWKSCFGMWCPDIFMVARAVFKPSDGVTKISAQQVADDWSVWWQPGPMAEVANAPFRMLNVWKIRRRLPERRESPKCSRNSGRTRPRLSFSTSPCSRKEWQAWMG